MVEISGSIPFTRFLGSWRNWKTHAVSGTPKPGTVGSEGSTPSEPIFTGRFMMNEDEYCIANTRPLPSTPLPTRNSDFVDDFMLHEDLIPHTRILNDIVQPKSYRPPVKYKRVICGICGDAETLTEADAKAAYWCGKYKCNSCACGKIIRATFGHGEPEPTPVIDSERGWLEWWNYFVLRWIGISLGQETKTIDGVECHVRWMPEFEWPGTWRGWQRTDDDGNLIRYVNQYGEVIFPEDI